MISVTLSYKEPDIIAAESSSVEFDLKSQIAA